MNVNDGDTVIQGQHECSRFLRDNQDARMILLKDWEKGTFDTLLSSETFLSFCKTMRWDKREVAREGQASVIPLETPSVQENSAPREVDITKESELGDHINVYGGDFTSILGNVICVAGDLWRITNSGDNYQSASEWFSAQDYRQVHNEIFKKRSKRTGGWFLQSPKYDEWRTSPEKRLMWCPGIPGVGKTVMASLVVDHLRMLDETQTFVGVIYFSYKLISEQSKLAILESLCRQVFDMAKDKTAFQGFYNSHSSRPLRPTEAELKDLLSNAYAKYQTAYLVLDALDEWTENYSDKQLHDLIRELLSIAVNVKLLVTSRILGDMEATFNRLDAIRHEIIAKEDDLRAYLEEKVMILKSRVDFTVSEPFTAEIVEKVVVLSKGRFLVAELNMNLLAEQLNAGELEDALNNLPNKVDETYARVMEHIYRYSDHRKQLAQKAIMLVAYAKRRLTVRELQHALATRPGRRETNKYTTPFSTISALCSGLIIAKDDHNSVAPQESDKRPVQLVHFTTQEFFTKFQTAYFSDAHNEIFFICIELITIAGNYMLSPAFSWYNIPSSSRADHIPFYDYASLCWGYHATTGSCSDKVLQFLLRTDWAVQLSCNYIMTQDLGRDDDELEAASECGVFLAAYHGISDALERLFEAIDHAPRTKCQWTPMHIAVIAGQISAVQTILKASETGDKPRHIEIDSMDYRLLTPFLRAAFRGDISIVELLLGQKGIDINARDKEGYTALQAAVDILHEPMVELLLNHEGINVNLADNDGSTPLSLAVRQGEDYDSIVMLLLNHRDIDINLKDRKDWTPLFHAAEYGHTSTTKLLLERPEAEINAKDWKGQTPFFKAARWARTPTMQLLLDHGGDMEVRDQDGVTPFHLAAFRHVPSAIRCFLDHGLTDMNAQDHGGYGVLHLACSWWMWMEYFPPKPADVVESIQLILEQDGVDVNLVDDEGNTPLYYAKEVVKAGRNFQHVVDLLEAYSAV